MSYFIKVLFVVSVFFCFFLIAATSITYFEKGVKHAEQQYLLRCYELEIDKKKCKKLITNKE